MAKKRPAAPPPQEGIISIIGTGMRIIGDCETADTIRIDGVVEGSVRADKAVKIGKDGRVTGDILTQDAVIAGTVKGGLQIHSRLELQATSRIDGEIKAARLHLEEGGVVNGMLAIGRNQDPPATVDLPVPPAATPTSGRKGRSAG